jgi:hypothetical protein
MAQPFIHDEDGNSECLFIMRLATTFTTSSSFGVPLHRHRSQCMGGCSSVRYCACVLLNMSTKSMYLQSSTDSKNLKTIQEAEKSRHCTDSTNMTLVFATERKLYKYMRSAIQVCNISQNVPVKGFSIGERMQNPRFQGKPRMDGGLVPFLARNYVLERKSKCLPEAGHRIQEIMRL